MYLHITGHDLNCASDVWSDSLVCLVDSMETRSSASDSGRTSGRSPNLKRLTLLALSHSAISLAGDLFGQWKHLKRACSLTCKSANSQIVDSFFFLPPRFFDLRTGVAGGPRVSQNSCTKKKLLLQYLFIWFLIMSGTFCTIGSRPVAASNCGGPNAPRPPAGSCVPREFNPLHQKPSYFDIL